MKTNDLILKYYRGAQGIRNFTEIWGDWRINNESKILKIMIRNLHPLLNEQNLKIINFKDIAYKSFNLPRNKTHENCVCCRGRRYNEIKKYDLIYPPILLKGKKYNSFNKEYRMIDGKHRMMNLVEKIKEGKYYFFVLSYNQVKNYIEEGSN